MDESPGLTPPTGGSQPQPRPGRHRHRRGTVAGVVAGILAGAAAIAVAIVLVRGGGGHAASAPPPASAATTSAPLPTLHIVFPEGFTREQMAERIRAVNEIARRKRHTGTSLLPREYLRETARSPLPGRFAGDGKPRSLEGFLFPATYAFTPLTTTRQLVAMQLAAFRRAWSRVDLAYARKRRLTPYDVLIIASMIEKEVRVPRERPLVAAVIYNRLKAGMPLGIDATLRYGLHLSPTEPITEQELHSDNPYNTRTRRGLPPTPIANPGLAAMQAAAHPAKAGYLYFVRRKDCRSHYFATTESAFLRFLNGPGSYLNGPSRCA